MILKQYKKNGDMGFSEIEQFANNAVSGTNTLTYYLNRFQKFWLIERLLKNGTIR